MDSSPRVVFYLLGRKGYVVLCEFVKAFGADRVARVICARDTGVSNDYFDEIEGYCLENGVFFLERTQEEPAAIADDYHHRFAIGWRWIIRKAERLIVFHDSLLPKYRGFAPLVNMLINGEPLLGVTALKASKEYDRGEILGQQSVDVRHPLKVADAIELIIPLYVALVADVFSRVLRNDRLLGSVQNEEYATYSLWRDDSDYFIDWKDDSERIVRFCHAVGDPYKGALTRLNDRVYRVVDAEVVPDVVVESRASHVGKVIFMEAAGAVVVCGRGLVRVVVETRESAADGKAGINFRSRFH